MNNRYRIRISSPLLRPGIKVETEVSERYLVPVLEKLLDSVREFNEKQDKRQKETQT